MKIDIVYDHTEARAATATAIDKTYQRRAAQLDPNHLVHAAKARIAPLKIPAQVHPLLSEAQERGMLIDDFCVLVLRKALDADCALIALDDQRRAEHRALQAATQGHQIAAIHARHS